MIWGVGGGGFVVQSSQVTVAERGRGWCRDHNEGIASRPETITRNEGVAGAETITGKHLGRQVVQCSLM